MIAFGFPDLSIPSGGQRFNVRFFIPSQIRPVRDPPSLRYRITACIPSGWTWAGFASGTTASPCPGLLRQLYHLPADHVPRFLVVIGREGSVFA